ncbi:hypothetical protein DFJ77DRAFT_482146, partial [Powellomyces hirtus]
MEKRVGKGGRIRFYYRVRTLSIWIMDDGLRISSGLSIATHGFSQADVEILSKVLWVKYGLKLHYIDLKPDLDQYTYILALDLCLY